jgi:hypothetical protein
VPHQALTRLRIITATRNEASREIVDAAFQFASDNAIKILITNMDLRAIEILTAQSACQFGDLSVLA